MFTKTTFCVIMAVQRGTIPLHPQRKIQPDGCVFLGQLAVGRGQAH